MILCRSYMLTRLLNHAFLVKMVYQFATFMVSKSFIIVLLLYMEVNFVIY